MNSKKERRQDIVNFITNESILNPVVYNTPEFTDLIKSIAGDLKDGKVVTVAIDGVLSEIKKGVTGIEICRVEV